MGDRFYESQATSRSIRTRMMLTGFTDFEKLTQHLAQSAKNRIARDAVRNGASVVNKRYKANTKASAFDAGTGTLRRASGVKTLTSKQTRIHGGVSVVGPRFGHDRSVVRPGRKSPTRADAARYAHLVEFGVKAHAIGKGSRLVVGRSRKHPEGKGPGPQAGGMHPGFPGRHILEITVDQSEGAVRAAVNRSVRAGLLREAKRARARANRKNPLRAWLRS